MPRTTFNAFFKLEAAGGILLLVAAIAAMILENSPGGSLYETFLNLPVQVQIGALDIRKPLFLWVNDGLMAVLWVSVLKSGVHATIAGVLLGFLIPLGDENSEDGSPLQNLLHDLHPWVAFGILPLFAFVNGGVSLEGMSLRSLLEPVPLGIVLGLFLGKQIGVFSFAWLSIKTGIAKLPDQVSMAQIYGTAVLCGVGFTMSLFISSLAYEEVGVGYAQSDRLGIILGSLLCGILGFAVLKLFPNPGTAGENP
jgi:NhaA family Na+:H+ antiporter